MILCLLSRQRRVKAATIATGGDGLNVKPEECFFRVSLDDHDRRLDRIIRKLLPNIGLSHIYRLIRTGKIRLNGRRSRPSTRANNGDRISVPPPIYAQYSPPAASDVERRGDETIRPPIILETDHILAVDKPRGLTVHGPDSLEQMVQSYLGPKQARSLSFRPGPVHRLDRNTTGILIFAKSLQGARRISRLIEEGRVEKYYLALMDGAIERQSCWKDSLARDKKTRKTVRALSGGPPSGGSPPGGSLPGGTAPEGKTALTHVKPIIVERNLSLVLCSLKTGRTHQIRAQAALHGHPLTGDRKYGGCNLTQTYLLHATYIRIPRDEALLGPTTLRAPLPLSSTSVISTFFGADSFGKIEQAIADFARFDYPPAID